MSSRQEHLEGRHGTIAENRTAERLTSHQTLAKSGVWSLVGQSIPLLVAVVAIPFLVKGLGVERFGVLMLVLVSIGYFSIFDFGLGRALTKLVAEKLGSRRFEEIPALVWTALGLMGAAGLLGTIVLSLLAPWLVHKALTIPRSLQFEALCGFYLMAVSIPVVISTAGLGGVLEAYQRFDLTGALRILLGVFTFLSPLIALAFTRSLAGIVAVLVVGRTGHWLAHLWLCFRIAPALRTISVHRSCLRPLISFGSWMTVTNLIGPVLMYLDRFLINAWVSVAAVTYYATPHEVVTKLTAIPSALVGVLFPAFSTCWAGDRDRAVKLFDRGAVYIFLTLFPITVVIVTLAREGLTLWLGQDFAQHSTIVLQWLVVGVFLNGLAAIPFAMVQAKGRPDLTAKLHLFELPIYLLLLWFLLGRLGIQGAAIAWVLRIGLDMVLLFVVAYRHSLVTGGSLHRLSAMVSAGLVILVLCAQVTPLMAKTMFLLLVLALLVPAAWLVILEPQERHFLRATLRIPSFPAPRNRT